MARVRTTDDTFCIAVLGDFLGEDLGCPGQENALWAPRRATPDSVMELTGLRPRLRDQHEPGRPAQEIELRELQDFHPDVLFRRLDRFAALRDARERAAKGTPERGADGETSADDVDPGAGRDGADTPTSGEGEGEGRGEGEAPPGSARDANHTGGLLDAIVDATEPSAGEVEPGTPEEIRAFAREAARPHLVPEDGDRERRVAEVDEAIGRELSLYMHADPFRSLEALWRSVVFLLSRVESTGTIRVYLVHLPRSKLEEDLSGSDDPRKSRLYQLLSSPPPGPTGRRWALVAGAYALHLTAQAMGVLEALGQVARAADVPWISSVASAPPPGEEPGTGALRSWLPDAPEEWHRLRKGTSAPWLGLTYPRFLPRELHGEEISRGELRFREKATVPSGLPWGEGCFLVASLLAQGFASGGWGFSPEGHLELTGMPTAELPGHPGNGRGCTEVALDPAGATALMEGGIIPLLSLPRTAAVRLGSLRSIALPPASLAGWWTR